MPHAACRRLRLKGHSRQVLLDLVAPAHLLEQRVGVHPGEAVILEDFSVVCVDARTLKDG